MEECSSQNCSICLEPITECPDPDAESQIHKNDCEHVFHGHCLSEWFRIGVPGNYCPLCRMSVEGMEAAELSSSDNEEMAEMSASEDEEDADDVPSSVSESEEPVSGIEQDQDEISEQVRQTVMQRLSEVEQGLMEIGSRVNVARMRISRVQELSQNLTPSTSNDQVREAISLMQETLNNIQENIDEAMGIIACASESRNQSTLLEMASELSEITQSIRQQSQTLENITGLVQTLE